MHFYYNKRVKGNKKRKYAKRHYYNHYLSGFQADAFFKLLIIYQEIMDNQPAKKSPVMAIVVAVIIIGIGVGAYFVMQNTDDENANVSNTNQVAESRYTADTFSFVQPEGWEQRSIQGTLVAFQDPNDSYPEGSVEATNQFKSYMAVVFDNVHERTMAEIVELNKEATIQANPSVAFTTEVEETIDGQPAIILEGQMTQQDVNFSIFMAFVAKGNRYFVVTGNTVTDKWDDYKDTFYGSARSFQFEYEDDEVTNDNTNQ